jgi:uncharacterized protein YuzE
MNEKSRSRETVIDYDEENDILYINFHNPPLEAGGTNRRGDFLFLSKYGAPTGITIMNFSHYAEVIKIIVEHKNRSLGKKING